MLVLVALGVIQQSPGAQAEHADQFQEREAAAGFLAAGLRIGALVFACVRQAGAGAIDHFDRQTAPKLAGFLDLSRRGATQARQNVPGHPGAGLAVGAAAGVHRAAAMEGKESLDLADDFAARAIGVEHLIKKAKEGAADAKDPLPAVGPLCGLGQQLRRQERAEELIQVDEALLAQVLDAPAQGSQARPPRGEERRFHNKYIYLYKP